MAGRSMAEQTLYCLEVVDELLNRMIGASTEEKRIIWRDWGRIEAQTRQMAERRVELTAIERAREDAVAFTSILRIPFPKSED